MDVPLTVMRLMVICAVVRGLRDVDDLIKHGNYDVVSEATSIGGRLDRRGIVRLIPPLIGMFFGL